MVRVADLANRCHALDKNLAGLAGGQLQKRVIAFLGYQLRLRAGAGEVPQALGTWWEDFSLADNAGREQLLRDAREAQAPRAKGQPRVHVRAPAAADAPHTSRAAPPPQEPALVDPDGLPETMAEDGDAAPRKRRRRRRKPGGDVGTPPSGGDLAA